MNVLLTNDDGIFSEGLSALANILNNGENNLFIYAPDGNRSGASHSASFHKKFSVKKVDYNGLNAYQVSGTPADCVRFALHFIPVKIDLVCAGINHGANLGSDVVYSGTVNACVEANMANIPAIAFSNTAFSEYNFDETAKTIKRYLNKLISNASANYVLNVNVPNVDSDKIKGVKVADLGVNRYADRYEILGNDEYKLVGEMLIPTENEKHTDVYYSVNDYVTVTPITHSYTKPEDFNKIKDSDFQ